MEISINLTDLTQEQLAGLIGHPEVSEVVKLDGAMLYDMRDEGWIPVESADLSAEWTHTVADSALPPEALIFTAA